jgi:hypothetical protein
MFVAVQTVLGKRQQPQGSALKTQLVWLLVAGRRYLNAACLVLIDLQCIITLSTFQIILASFMHD